MTFDEMKKSAYRGAAVPDGMTENERFQFVAARRVYAGFRSGEIDRTEAEPMIAFTRDYSHLQIREKRSLLQYIFALLCADAGNGDSEALTLSKFVARLQSSMGRR